LNRIKDFFAIFQFEASKKIIERLLDESAWLGEAEVGQGEEEQNNEKQHMLDIKEIIEAFISWERFDNKNALSHFNRVKLQNVSKQQSYLENLTDFFNKSYSTRTSTNHIPYYRYFSKCKKKVTRRKL
jgi:hypothetical protein